MVDSDSIGLTSANIGRDLGVEVGRGLKTIDTELDKEFFNLIS